MVIFFQLSWPLPCVEQMFSAAGCKQDIRRNSSESRETSGHHYNITLRSSGDSVDFTTAIIVFGTQSSQKPHAMISDSLSF